MACDLGRRSPWPVALRPRVRARHRWRPAHGPAAGRAVTRQAIRKQKRLARERSQGVPAAEDAGRPDTTAGHPDPTTTSRRTASPASPRLGVRPDGVTASRRTASGGHAIRRSIGPDGDRSGTFEKIRLGQGRTSRVRGLMTRSLRSELRSGVAPGEPERRLRARRIKKRRGDGLRTARQVFRRSDGGGRRGRRLLDPRSRGPHLGCHIGVPLGGVAAVPGRSRGDQHESEQQQTHHRRNGGGPTRGPPRTPHEPDHSPAGRNMRIPLQRPTHPLYRSVWWCVRRRGSGRCAAISAPLYGGRPANVSAG